MYEPHSSSEAPGHQTMTLNQPVRDKPVSHSLTVICFVGGMAEDKSSKKWRIADFCRAVFFEDGLTYEAEIISIGGARCRLRYVGYGNEEDQPLAKLQPSAGKKARRKQEKEAERESKAVDGAEEEEYEERDVEEVGDGQEEQETNEEAEEEVPKLEKSAQRGLRKSLKSAVRQGFVSTQDSTAAGHSQWDAGQEYPAASQQSEQAGQYAGQSYPGWGPWGPGSEHYGPPTGPRAPHWGPWGPKPGPWTPPHGTWGAAPPFVGPWGALQGPQAQQGFRGPSDIGASFHSHPLPPPPPPPPPIPDDTDPVQLANMLMSWYINGYHTGYYQASREAARASRAGRK